MPRVKASNEDAFTSWIMSCFRGDCLVQSAKVDELFKKKEKKKAGSSGGELWENCISRPWGLDLWLSTLLFAILNVWTPGPVMLLQKFSLKAGSYSLPWIYSYLLPTHSVMPFSRQFLNKLPTTQLLPVALDPSFYVDLTAPTELHLVVDTIYCPPPAHRGLNNCFTLRGLHLGR